MSNKSSFSDVQSFFDFLTKTFGLPLFRVHTAAIDTTPPSFLLEYRSTFDRDAVGSFDMEDLHAQEKKITAFLENIKNRKAAAIKTLQNEMNTLDEVTQSMRRYIVTMQINNVRKVLFKECPGKWNLCGQRIDDIYVFEDDVQDIAHLAEIDSEGTLIAQSTVPIRCEGTYTRGMLYESLARTYAMEQEDDDGAMVWIKNATERSMYAMASFHQETKVIQHVTFRTGGDNVVVKFKDHKPDELAVVPD